MNRHAQARRHAQLRSRIHSRNSIQSRNGAFTLVELMIVIIIIGILAGLLSVAAYNAVLAARKTRVKAEIDNLDMTLQQYATDWGEAPPCMGYYQVVIPNRANRFISHLRRAFPRFTVIPGTSNPLVYTDAFGNGGLKEYVQDNYGLDLAGIDQAEALVFWLGGPPATPTTTLVEPSSTKLLGWSANASNPFQITGSRRKASFEFVEARLTDHDQDGWYEYVPDITASAGLIPPYVYFDSASYDTPKNVPIGYPTNNTSSMPFTPKSQISNWGYALPYVAKVTPNPMPSKPHLPTFVNPKKFQIISCGLDGSYGGDRVINGTNPYPTFPMFPSGTNYTDGDQDNLTNFSEGTLKDAIK